MTAASVGPRLGPRADDGFPRLLVAFDGSPSARDALEEGIRLARSHEAHITIITVTPVLQLPAPDGKPQPGEPVWPPDDDYLRLLREAAGRVPGDISVATVLARGPAASAIVDHAQRGRHDLVVMGSRGRGRGRPRALGSVSQRVLSQATVPVVIVDGKERRRDVDIDHMGECSFPASDPPATWTWDVEPGSGRARAKMHTRAHVPRPSVTGESSHDRSLRC